MCIGAAHRGDPIGQILCGIVPIIDRDEFLSTLSRGCCCTILGHTNEEDPIVEMSGCN